MNEDRRPALPAEQVVLVLQGGGALGAYQAGVYQGLHEAGVEPTWVVGTSIGAINAALICGNRPEDRLGKLEKFWSRVGYERQLDQAWWWSSLTGALVEPEHFAQGYSRVLRAQSAGRLGDRGRSWGSIAQPFTAPSRSRRRRANWWTSTTSTEAHSPHRRRRQRAQRRDEIFRLPPHARSGSSTSWRRARCRRRFRRSVSRGAVLGRRRLFQHADRGRARRPAASRRSDLRGQCLAAAWLRTHDDLASHESP